MPILTNTGRVVIAESVALRPLHLAWGLGDGNWNTPPSEQIGATGLINEIGRRKVTETAFVKSDPAGDIVLPTGTFSRSETPTNNLLLVTLFDFGDAPSSIIREVGIFAGTQTNPGLPAGQGYFVPADVINTGRLLHLENIVPIFRSSSIKANFEIVINF